MKNRRLLKSVPSERCLRIVSIFSGVSVGFWWVYTSPRCLSSLQSALADGMYNMVIL